MTEQDIEIQRLRAENAMQRKKYYESRNRRADDAEIH